jgi:hypothetical protein
MGGSAGDFTRNDLVSVGTASGIVADANPRITIYIRNSSAAAQEITLHVGYGQAEVNKGIILKAGESWLDSSGDGYPCYQGVITAISSAAGGQVSVFER